MWRLEREAERDGGRTERQGQRAEDATEQVTHPKTNPFLSLESRNGVFGFLQGLILRETESSGEEE
jgi:hypothetical protein